MIRAGAVASLLSGSQIWAYFKACSKTALEDVRYIVTKIRIKFRPLCDRRIGVI